MLHKGSCHCGRIAFEVEGGIGQGIECNCSVEHVDGRSI